MCVHLSSAPRILQQLFLGTPPASVFIISIGILLYFFKTLKCEIPLCVCGGRRGWVLIRE